MMRHIRPNYGNKIRCKKCGGWAHVASNCWSPRSSGQFSNHRKEQHQKSGVVTRDNVVWKSKALSAADTEKNVADSVADISKLVGGGVKGGLFGFSVNCCTYRNLYPLLYCSKSCYSLLREDFLNGNFYRETLLVGGDGNVPLRSDFFPPSWVLVVKQCR